MHFPLGTPLENIIDWTRHQISSLTNVCPNGLEVNIKPFKPLRSHPQNRFMHEVFANIVRFYNETGFIPDSLPKWVMNTDALKIYFKAKFGVIETARLSRSEMVEFIDNIQRLMVEQSAGEYEILNPDDLRYGDWTEKR